jgi:excisionase family DNA binding protein
VFAIQTPELLRVTEAAERLNVSPASVYRWIDEGRVPAVRLGGPGSPLRVPTGELEDWLALGRVTPLSATRPTMTRAVDSRRRPPTRHAAEHKHWEAMDEIARLKETPVDKADAEASE